MAVFSTNQVRHLYVAKNVGTEKNGVLPTVGDILPINKEDQNGNYLYFKYRGFGGPMRSDLIKVDSIRWAKHSPATSKTQNRFLQKAQVKLDPSYLTDGKVVSGQDYILRIVIRQFAGMSDEDTYIKYGIVHGTPTMTPSDFYKKMAISLAKNFSRELTTLFKFKLGNTEVTPLTKESDLAEVTADSLTIEEVEQDWILGIKQSTPVYFEVYPTTITFDGEEVQWGIDAVTEAATITLTDSTESVPNSKILADLEYFCMGERGDIYRKVGWPNYVPTKYMLDGEDLEGYDVLDIHYYFEGEGQSPQKSEKDITIVAKSAVMTSIVEKLNSIEGLTVSVTE